MCYTGGPRCSGHVSKELAKAREAFASDPSESNMERVRAKAREFLKTPAGIKFLRTGGESVLADQYEKDRAELVAERRKEADVKDYIQRVSEEKEFNDYVRLAQEGGLRIEGLEVNGRDVTFRASRTWNDDDLIENEYQGFAEKSMLNHPEAMKAMADAARENGEGVLSLGEEYMAEREDLENSLRSGVLLRTNSDDAAAKVERQATAIRNIHWEIKDETDYLGVLQEYLEGLDDEEEED